MGEVNCCRVCKATRDFVTRSLLGDGQSLQEFQAAMLSQIAFCQIYSPEAEVERLCEAHRSVYDSGLSKYQERRKVGA